MRQAIENIHGALRDKELPSKSLVAQKLEQIEDNAFHVEDLRDVTSLEDSPQRLLSCASSPARPSPANAEQLRLRHRRIGLTCEMLRTTKHSARPWLPESLLGWLPQVVRPHPWREDRWHERACPHGALRCNMRAKCAVRDGSATDLNAALSAACSAPELYTMHFIGPMSFATFASAGGDALDTQEIDSRRRPYGKGRGKGGKRPAAPPIKRTIKKHSRTNDGQLICFAFNEVTKSLGADASSDEDEDGDPKPKLGLGPWAAPDFNAHGQAKGIFRWLWALLAGVGMPCMRLLAMKLAAGKVNDCPFPRAAVEDGRQLVFVALEMAGAKLDVRTREARAKFDSLAVASLGAIEKKDGRAEMALLVFVDDLFWLTREKGGIEKIVISVYFLVILGLPFSWSKFCGGLDVSWVGFTLDLKGNLLGLSVARAAWVVKWLQDCVSAGSVRIADMCAALGRLSFALSVLDHLRPFLGPMYAWVTALENARVYRLPKAIKLIMLFLAKALAGDGRLTPVGLKLIADTGNTEQGISLDKQMTLEPENPAASTAPKPHNTVNPSPHQTVFMG
ncbi:Spore wall protein 2 [Durusdinium trenchii]|uniref:Spore wall protein 2 n=1 Tax=Durusdinium trenchii TaxID=1381693 RepID=A0ABP0JSK2_9DINO